MPNKLAIIGAVKMLSQLLDIKNTANRKVFPVVAFVMLVVFGVGLWISWRREDAEINWNVSGAFLFAMLGLLTLTYVVNTLRVHLHSRIVGADLKLTDNARMSLYGTAMNMVPFPLPAGMLFKMSNYVRHGGNSRFVAAVLVTNYVLALASSLLIGLAMLTNNGFADILSLLVLVALAYLATAAVFIYLAGPRRGTMIAALELLTVANDAVRLCICFEIMGFDIQLFQTAMLTISSVLGSAFSIVPAGLGIRELVGAAISPLIDLQPAQAFLAIALDRLFNMVFFLVLAGIAMIADRTAKNSRA